MRHKTYFTGGSGNIGRLATAALLLVLAGAGSGRGQAAAPATEPTADGAAATTTLDRANYTLTYPATWKEDKNARDYKPDTNITLDSPKNSYIQFRILDKTETPEKLLSMAVNSLDGPAINSVTRTKLTEWGSYKGEGVDMKGNILDSFPGGIIVFVFSTKSHSVLVEEYYFSDELRDILKPIQDIRKSFQIKD